MHPRKLWDGMMELDRRQQNASPCPNRNGTTIGTTQSFTLFCGADVGGNVMQTFDAFDLRTCADICSSFHPRCDGATFDGSSCQLKARLSVGGVQQSRNVDSVVGIFPSASSNCRGLGATTSQRGTTWNLACGSVVAGFDISQNFAPTLQDCMGQCTSTSGCAAVSFDASLDQGFKNCYLKSTVSDGSVIVQDGRVDTALMQGVGNVSPSEGGAIPASSSAFPNQGVATVPLPTPTGGGTNTGNGGNGAVIFTPPSNTAVANPGTSNAPLATELIPSATQLAPPQFLPSGNGGFTFTGLPDSSSVQQNDDNGSSNAWIAAPVVGSVAAIALIVLSFVMLKRRRLGNRDTLASNSSNDSLRPRKRNISRPMALSAIITSWLPTAARGDRGSAGSGRSRGKMGNFSEVTGKQPASRSSMRTSVTGLVRPGLAMGGGDRLGDVEEGSDEKKRGELRNSLNGLGQNRWS